MFKILYAYKCPKVFPTPQWNLYKADTIGTMNSFPLYRSVGLIRKLKKWCKRVGWLLKAIIISISVLPSPFWTFLIVDPISDHLQLWKQMTRVSIWLDGFVVVYLQLWLLGLVNWGRGLTPHTWHIGEYLECNLKQILAKLHRKANFVLK